MAGEKIAAAGHDRLPAYGSGAAQAQAEWQTILRQLVAGGFLLLDVAGYGGLALSEKGRALLRGEGAFHHRPAAPRAPTKRSLRATAAAASDDADAPLLAALKDLRLRLAKQRRVPAYAIFPDRTLLDMVQRRPRTIAEFAEVNGVGAKKLQEFGAAFLKVIQQPET